MFNGVLNTPLIGYCFVDVNPFVPITPFFYPLSTIFSGGRERVHWVQIETLYPYLFSNLTTFLFIHRKTPHSCQYQMKYWYLYFKSSQSKQWQNVLESVNSFIGWPVMNLYVSFLLFFLLLVIWLLFVSHNQFQDTSLFPYTLKIRKWDVFRG